MKGLVKVYTRLFKEDVRALKASASEKGLPWQIELRLLVHRAVSEKEVPVLQLDPTPKKGPR